MKTISLAIVVVMLTANPAEAEHHHKDWIKYFAGAWKIHEPGGTLDWKLVADGDATIGTGESANGQDKSAWIAGWDATEKTMIHEWFGTAHGRVCYRIANDKTLCGPGEIHAENEITKGTVEITKKSDRMFTVHWTNVTVNGEKSDDIHLVVERR